MGCAQTRGTGGVSSAFASPGERTMEWWATLRSASLLIAILVMASVPMLAAAQPGVAGVTLVASGLAFPRGFTWDESGSMYVALAGDGSPSTAATASSGT